LDGEPAGISRASRPTAIKDIVLLPSRPMAVVIRFNMEVPL
jgi:hypothetical protein